MGATVTRVVGGTAGKIAAQVAVTLADAATLPESNAVRTLEKSINAGDIPGVTQAEVAIGRIREKDHDVLIVVSHNPEK